MGSLCVSLGSPLQERADLTKSVSTLSSAHPTFLSLQQPLECERTFINALTTEERSGKDLFAIWKRITHALVSLGRVAELHQELDSASRTSREDRRPWSQLTVRSCHDYPFMSDELLAAAAKIKIADNNNFICYDEDGDSAVCSGFKCDWLKARSQNT